MTKKEIKTFVGGEKVSFTDPLMNVKMEGTVRYQDGINLMVDFSNGSASQWILENCPEEIPELSS